MNTWLGRRSSFSEQFLNDALLGVRNFVIDQLMRFLPHEHADIMAALTDRGVDPLTVLFVKRRGRLHVEIPGRTDAFVFFREKSTKLGDDGRWQERVQYLLGKGKTEPCDWSGVLSAFQGWLERF